MKTQIVNVSKLQTSKVMAVLYLAFSVPFALFYACLGMFSHQGAGVAWGMAIFMLVLYPILGFVFTFFGALVYNGIARKIGGIQFTVSNAESN
jgi:hypothetical protein